MTTPEETRRHLDSLRWSASAVEIPRSTQHVLLAAASHLEALASELAEAKVEREEARGEIASLSVDLGAAVRRADELMGALEWVHNQTGEVQPHDGTGHSIAQDLIEAQRKAGGG